MSSEAQPIEFHVLREQHCFLMESLEAIDVSRILYSKEVITTIQYEIIQSKTSRPEQVGKLLEQLRSNTHMKNAFSVLCEALHSIKGLDWIAERLQEELKTKEHSSRDRYAVKDTIQINEGIHMEGLAQTQPIPIHFLGTSPLIPFMDALQQFKTYLQVLLKSKDVNAEVRTVINPEISVSSFMKIIEIICELRVSPSTYEKIIFDFANMKMKLSSALKRNEDALSLMKAYVTTVSMHVPNLKITMDKVNTTEDLLLVTQDLWTRTGVDYIRKMIEGTGCQEAIKVLEDYLHLQVPFAYSEPHAVENMPTAAMVDVSATLEGDLITTEVYSKAKNDICWTLCLPSSALVYSGVSKGSIIIHWKLSASLVDYVKSISVNAIDICKPFLKLNGIRKITVGDDAVVSCMDNVEATRNVSGMKLKLNHQDKTKISELIAACKRGDIQVVKNIIDEGISYNCMDEDGVSPLQSATQLELQWEVAEWLLSLGALNSEGINEQTRDLLNTCKNGNSTSVENILQSCINTNCRNIDGATPLILAASIGNQEIVKMLLSYNADINSCDKTGSSALFLACKYGHKEVVDLLLAGGADVNLKTDKGAAPLLIASQEGHYEIVQKLVCVPAIQLHITAFDFTALHFACMSGHAEIAKRLLDAGLDVNNQTPIGATPLYVTSETGHAHVVKFLIDNKARLDLKLNTGATALHIASYNGHCNVVMLLVTAGCDVDSQNNVGSTALFLASQNGHCAVVNALLAAKSNVNLYTKDDGSPLIIASKGGYVNVVHTLIGAMADINHLSSDGITALGYASLHGHRNVVDTLIAAKADVNLCSRYNYTPLYCASEGGHEAIVQTLIDAGGDTNAQTFEGCTSLHVAIFFGRTSIASILIAAECNVNIKNNRNTTALALACAHGYQRIVELLIEKDANLNLQDTYKCTALHHASTNQQKAIVKLLCDAGADLNLQCDITGLTPLHIASLTGNADIVHILIAANACVNSQSFANGWTALIPAACLGSVDIVLDLRSANADINLEDKFGKTALEYAIMKQRGNVVQVLIQCGANINHQVQPQGWTPLMLAAQNGNLEITKLLCAHPDIQLQTKDNFGNTAMDIALSHHHNLVHEELEQKTNIKGRNAPIEVTESNENHRWLNEFWSALCKNVQNNQSSIQMEQNPNLLISAY